MHIIAIYFVKECFKFVYLFNCRVFKYTWFLTVTLVNYLRWFNLLVVSIDSESCLRGGDGEGWGRVGSRGLVYFSLQRHFVNRDFIKYFLYIFMSMKLSYILIKCHCHLMSWRELKCYFHAGILASAVALFTAVKFSSRGYWSTFGEFLVQGWRSYD